MEQTKSGISTGTPSDALLEMKASLLSSLDYKQRSEASKKLESRTFRAVIYARVSTKEQAGEDKTSIPAQIEKCHEIIKLKGWEFIEEYRDEGISGHLTIERNGLQSMLRDAREHKFDLIVVKDYDRFAREKDAAAIIRQELKKLGIQIYAINSPFDPESLSKYEPDENDLRKMIEAFSDMRADMERGQIKRRLREGKENLAKAGILPNRVPYGYKVVRYIEENKKVKRKIEIDDEAAERVRFIFTQYVSGIGLRKISIEMNNRGWKSPMISRWTTRGIKYILGNAVYTGKVLWGWRHSEYSTTKEWISRGKMGYIVDGKHPPIIDEVTFLKAQEIREGRKRGARGGCERSFGILTGIAKCIRCGSGVGYQKRYHKRSDENPNWKDTTTFEYICTGYKYSGICSARVMSATKLEGVVIDHIKNLYAHPKVQEKIVYDGTDQDSLDRDKAIKRLEYEIASVNEKEKRHTDAYERGIESIDQYQNNIGRIREETQRNHKELDGLKSLCSLTSQKSDIIAKLVASMHNFDNFWGELQLDEKKLIIRSIIREIRAGEGKVEIDFIL